MVSDTGRDGGPREMRVPNKKEKNASLDGGASGTRLYRVFLNNLL